MIIGTFDPEQLGAVEAGGMFPLIAKRHGSRRLYDVRRFERAWEREASLKLRDGDISAMLAYKGHGMVRDGTQDRMYDDAVDAWLVDFAEGKRTLLLAASNEEAAGAGEAGPRAARRARPAGPGRRDHALGRQRRRDRRSCPGPAEHEDRRGRANAQQPGHDPDHRVPERRQGARSRPLSVSLGPGRWSAPFDVPAAYLRAERGARLRRKRVREPRPARSIRAT